MPAKYQLYKDKAGKYRFRLVAENGKYIVYGEAYERRKSCLNGIESVRKNSGSTVEDTTIDSPKMPFPKYQVLLDKAGEYRFNLSASNGEVVASSEGYSSKKSCLNGIETVRRIGNSEIEDLTTIAETQEEPAMEPIPAVVQEEVESPKQVEFEEAYKEEEKKIPTPAVVATPPKETTIIYDEDQTTKSKGISGVAVAVLIIGLLVGFILLAISLGFGGFFGGAVDAVAKAVVLFFGLLIICASILFFFAKK